MEYVRTVYFWCTTVAKESPSALQFSTEYAQTVHFRRTTGYAVPICSAILNAEYAQTVHSGARLMDAVPMSSSHVTAYFTILCGCCYAISTQSMHRLCILQSFCVNAEEVYGSACTFEQHQTCPSAVMQCD
eukprot:1142382-Pelagomonas_calceolata.AAC.3